MEDLSTKEKAQAAFVRQHDASEGGMACLAAVVRYYGAEIEQERLWVQIGAGPQGTTLRGLYEAAEAIGLKAGAYEADLDNLKTLGAPCLLHVVKREGRPCFVVCYGYERKRFILGDPGVGVLECSPTKLERMWRSRALLTLEPTGSFEEHIAKLRAEADDAPPAEYSCLGVAATSFGGDDVTLRSKRTGNAAIAPALLAQLLLSLRNFDTLEGHAAACLKQARQHSNEKGKGGLGDGASGVVSLESVRRQLDVLVREGFLVSRSDLRAEFLTMSRKTAEQEEGTSTAAQITTIGIPTKDRPRVLKRALESYLTNTQCYGRTPTFVIADDSENTKIQKQNKQMLQRLKERYFAPLRYVDESQKRVYAEALASRAGVRPEITRFALLGEEHPSVINYGASRNALLLDAGGEVCMQIDDDTVCEVAAAPEKKDELLLTSKPDTYEFWFFDNHDEALEAVTVEARDFLSIHEQLLGKKLGQCLRTDVSWRVGNVDEAFLEGASSSNARIVVSFAGAVGDSGMRHNQHRIFLEGSSYERLVTQKYRSQLNTRQILRVPVQPAISNGLGCISMHLGLDARELLPPFMPAGRNLDGIFGGALKVCSPHAYRGFLPYAIRHAPPSRRSNPPVDVRFAALNANDIILRLILSFSAWPRGNRRSAMVGLGRYLQDLGSVSLRAFIDYIDNVLSQEVGQRVLHAQRLRASRPDAPAEWKDDVERYIRSAKKTVTRNRLCVPYDLPGSDAEKKTLLQERIHRYGTLLTHWPVITEAAAALRDEGVGLAVDG